MTFASAAVVSVHIQSMFELLEVAVFHLFVLIDEIVVFWMLPDVLATDTIMLHLNQKLLMRRQISIYKVLCRQLFLRNSFLLCSNWTPHRIKLCILHPLIRSHMMFISVTNHGWIISTSMMRNDVKCLLIKLCLVHHHLLLVCRASFESTTFAGLLRIKLLRCHSLIPMQLL